MVMDVDAALYPRKDIERVGIAPLTSMFQHGENDRRRANDWRPGDPRFGRPVDVGRLPANGFGARSRTRAQIRFSAFSDE